MGSGGWFKIHRGMWDNELRFIERAILVELLKRVTFREGWIRWRGKRRRIMPGQGIISVVGLAKELEVGHKAVRNTLKTLSERDTISLESGKDGTIVTICNWEKYQLIEEDEGKIGARYGQDRGNIRRREEGKKVRKKKIDIPRDRHKDDIAVAEAWFSFASGLKPRATFSMNKFLDTARLLRERDGYSRAQILDTLEFVKGDDFWRDKAVSLCGLRQRGKNDLPKIENIRSAMSRNQPSQADKEAQWARVRLLIEEDEKKEQNAVRGISDHHR